MGSARLFVDASSEAPFAGSCSVVTHLLRRALDAEETFVRPPRIDEHGNVVAAERLAVPQRDEIDDLFFEEVFLRVEGADRRRAHVYFNLMCFGDHDVDRFAGARTLLFNSEFLRRVFEAHVLDPRRTHRLATFAETRLSACPPAPPPFSFPKGYPSIGEELADSEIELLRNGCVLGHALRPGLDPIAAVAIMHALRKLMPARLFVLRSQLKALLDTAEILGIADAEALFVPVRRLDNPSLLRLMGASDFGLAYDTSIEAFGFYALESVLCGSPLYSNGAGNLRHLLSPGRGIDCQETIAMAFGEHAELLAAYARVAEKIAREVCLGVGRGRCALGRAEIAERYSVASFEDALGAALSASVAPVERRVASDFGLHPLVRRCNLRTGRIITDEGPIGLDAPALACLKRVLETGTLDGPSDAIDALLDLHVVSARRTDAVDDSRDTPKAPSSRSRSYCGSTPPA